MRLRESTLIEGVSLPPERSHSFGPESLFARRHHAPARLIPCFGLVGVALRFVVQRLLDPDRRTLRLRRREIQFVRQPFQKRQTVAAVALSTPCVGAESADRQYVLLGRSPALCL